MARANAEKANAEAEIAKANAEIAKANAGKLPQREQKRRAYMQKQQFKPQFTPQQFKPMPKDVAHAGTRDPLSQHRIAGHDSCISW